MNVNYPYPETTEDYIASIMEKLGRQWIEMRLVSSVVTLNNFAMICSSGHDLRA